MGSSPKVLSIVAAAALSFVAAAVPARAEPPVTPEKIASYEDAESLLAFGIIVAGKGDVVGATTIWENYLSRFGRSETDSDGRKRLAGSLRRSIDLAIAEQALAGELEISQLPVDPRALAIPALYNVGSEEYSSLGRALSRMLAHNLAGVPELRLVERAKVAAIVSEARLSDDLVAEGTATRVGRLVGAGRVAVGNYGNAGEGPDALLKAEVALFDAASGSMAGSANAARRLDEFYEVVPALAAGLVRHLSPTPVDAPELTETHTKNLQAALRFGSGLRLMDAGRLSSARAAFSEAVELDPDFKLARAEMAFLPLAGLSVASRTPGIRVYGGVTATVLTAVVAVLTLPWKGIASMFGGDDEDAKTRRRIER